MDFSWHPRQHNSNSSSHRYEMFFLAKDVPPAFIEEPGRFPPSVIAPCAAARPVSAAYRTRA